jgi:nitroimidazol reductase NimA-like FMN-containing flavoprotein (pyridoxamine 5'-phosphate oxidase superfamily)
MTARLSASESWRLLEGQRVGRLSVTAGDGMPDIFPVNYVSFQGSLYIRTAPDTKVVAISTHPFAAFEVDGETDEGWWSVVVRGGAALIRDPVELERTGVLRLETASPRHKQHVIKLVVNTISGRRFAHRDAGAPLTVRRAAAAESGDDGASERQRRVRPAEIPSLPPLEDGAGATRSRAAPSTDGD